jgi:uncharacterized protein YjiS (DUF1127 family)
MAYATTSHSSFARPQGDSLLARLASHFAARRRYHETRRELGALSDRDLMDLGIHRSNISDIAAEAARNF